MAVPTPPRGVYVWSGTAAIAVGLGTPGQVDPPPVDPGPTATVPGQVASLNRSVGNGVVVLDWTPPTSNGGSAITAYQVAVSPTPSGGQPAPLGASARNISISGLTNGTLYTFTVNAVNAKGSGPGRNIQGTPTSAVQKPGPTNTGVPAGTVLTTNSTRQISSSGGTYVGVHFTNGVEITGSNNTFRKCKFGPMDGGPNTVYVRGGSGTVIEDSEIIGGRNGIAFGNYTLRRSQVHSYYQDGCKVSSNTRIEDCWIYDSNPVTGAHADAIQMEEGSSNLYLLRNHVDPRSIGGGSGGNENGNAAMIIKPDFSPGTGPILIEGNWVAAGNFTIFFRVGQQPGYYTQSGVTFRNNIWLGTPPKGYATYGPISRDMPCVWENNRWENGTLIP